MTAREQARIMTEEEMQEEQRQPAPLTAGERARAERDLRMGAHPIQGEKENSAFLV